MNQRTATICLLVISLLIAGCGSGRTPDRATPTPAVTDSPARTATSQRADPPQIETLCLQIDDTKLKYADLAMIKSSLEHLVSLAVGRVERGGSATCDATLLVVLSGSPRSGEYGDHSTKKMLTCYTGATVRADMTLQQPQREPWVVSTSGEDPVDKGGTLSCPSESEAPFYRISVEVLIDGLRTIWGTQMLVYAWTLDPGWSRDTLGELDPEAAVPEIIQVLEAHPKPYVRKAALEILVEIGPTVPATLPAARRSLEDADAAVRDAAIEALALLEPDAPEVVRHRVDLLKNSKEEEVRIAAARFLGRSKADETVLRALVDVLEDVAVSDRLRAEVGSALTTMGPAATPLLSEALSHEDNSVVMASALALKNMETPSEEAIYPLLECMDSTSWGDVGDGCAAALVAIGPAAAEPLVQYFVARGTGVGRGGCDRWTIAALENLAASSPQIRDAIPMLIECMAFEVERDRSWWEYAHSALKTVTGVDYSNDVAGWREWWSKNR